MLGVELELRSSISNAKFRRNFGLARTLLSHYSASTVFTELVVPKLLELKLYMFLRQLNEVK